LTHGVIPEHLYKVESTTPGQDEVKSISHREEARRKLLAVLAQLQRNIAEMQAVVLQYHEPDDEGPIDTTPEPEATPEPTTSEPKPGEKHSGILNTFYLFPAAAAAGSLMKCGMYSMLAV